MKNIWEQIKENKKLMYVILAVVIIAGMLSIYFFRLNFSLDYQAHTQINLYLQKRYEMKDIQAIGKEVFGNKQVDYRQLETFQDSVCIAVADASEEELTNLKAKMKEKYSVEEEDFMVTTQIPHLRGRDLVKPYIIPTIIVTLITMGYIGVRYMKLGAMHKMFQFIFRLVATELVYLSIIGILNLPIGSYTMPIAIALYLVVTMLTVVQDQNTLEYKEKTEKEEKKK